MTETLPDKLPAFKRADFEDTCKRRFLYGLGFDCYGGVGGLYDFGPVGCQVKANFINLWRQHFVIEENMLEVDTTCMTPEEVFKVSGHTQKFTDVMVQDSATGDLFRVDKYLEEWGEKKLADKKAKLTDEQRADIKKLIITADGMSIPEFKAALSKFEVKSPQGNSFGEPKDFNLMFPTPIGPAGDRLGYLRPELAQGILLNFKRLLEFNAGNMPFAGAAIGSAFRNEIAPRNNLLRVREFTLAEIEHFVNPDDKDCVKFAQVASVEAWLWPKDLQEDGKDPIKMTLGDAVSKGIIDNETLGYFMGRTMMFTQMIGMKYLRFRQHRSTEMAHYASDCWDAECLSSFGWVECVGLADRSCYDLECHGKARNTDFVAYEKFPEPKIVNQLDRDIKKGLVNKTFKKDAPAVLAFLNQLPEAEALALDQKLNDGAVSIAVGEVSYSIERAMVQFAMKDKKIEGRNYIPNVIEPSFGVGRLIYTLLEQTYFVRKSAEEDSKNEKRAGFALPARIAPYKVSILPLSPTVFRVCVFAVFSISLIYYFYSPPVCQRIFHKCCLSPPTI